MAAVSVITPAWNAAAWLPETIASVLAQTHADWEWLIVDDGSADDTGVIVERASRADARIRLLRQSNAGPSAARNRAMREARGEYFAFLDSDDVWDPRFLDAQLQVFSAHPETHLVTATALNLGGPFNGRPTRRISTGGTPVLPLDELILDETSAFIMTVFRREVFETIGGFDESQWTSEDYDFWIRAAQAGFVFRCNPVPLGQYRVHDGSLSQHRARMLEGILLSYRKAQARAAATATEGSAIARQIQRFESELLLEQAKTALEQRQFAAAAERLDALRARGGNMLVAITAWLARHLPPAAAAAYRLRGWRPRFAGASTKQDATYMSL
ncbi:MAG TPA: glycosyltransferase [Vicinamibacterales bacterium]|nr:glycosyltransferase [Vicinamibacterales bacterium]